MRSNKRFAREYLLTLIDEEDGPTPFDALKHTICRMGVKEFAEYSSIPEKSISRMLNSETMPKLETLERYFYCFGLRVKIALERVA